MACVSNAKAAGEIDDEKGLGNREFNKGEKKATWAYEIVELYKLNNPVSLAKLKGNGWLKGPPQKYNYVPPVVVSEMQANLRCQIFPGEDDYEEADLEGDGDEFGDVIQDSQTENLPPPRTPPPYTQQSISQQVAAQLHSDFIHSTQRPPANDDDATLDPSTGTPPHIRSSDCALPPMPPPTNRPRPSAARKSPSAAISRTPSKPRTTRLVNPSQATTASGSSSPSPHKSSLPRRPPGVVSQDDSLPNFNPISPVKIPEGVEYRDVRMGSSQVGRGVSQFLPNSLVDSSRIIVEDSEGDDDDEL